MADDTQPDPTQTADTTNAPPATGGDPGSAQSTLTQAQQPTPGLQTTPQSTSATIAPEQQAQSPTVLIPQKRGGLGGIVDEIRNALVPQQATEIYRDPETGERYVQRPGRTPGQQWMKLAGEAVTGAAAGLANGQGPGGPQRAAAAGVQQGVQQQQQAQQTQEKQADDDYNIARQQRMDKANSYLQQVQLASQEFALKRMQVKAGQDDIDFSQRMNQQEHDRGSIDLGTYGDHYSLPDVQKNHPEIDFWKQGVSGMIQAHADVDPETGTRKGVHLWLTQPGILDQPAEPGTQAHRVEYDKDNVPHVVQFTPTGTHTQREFQSMDDYAYGVVQKYQAGQAENALKGAQTKEASAAAGKNVAEAGEARATTAKTNNELASNQSSSGLVDQIGQGKVVPERLSYLLARNPELINQVTQKYPNFDSSKAEAYPTTYKDFTSGKTSVALNSADTALKHLKELQDLNTVASHIPGTPAHTKYVNKLGTVAPELARFYGDETIPGIASIRDTLGSTLPGSRDAAIRTQAQSMGDKLDSYEQTWKNSAPSASYQAPMPGISEKAKDARAALDPAYRARQVQQLQPPAQTFQYKTADGKMGWNGQKWVPTATGTATPQ